MRHASKWSWLRWNALTKTGVRSLARSQVDPQRFREAYTSKYNKIRIFKVLKVSQKSKEVSERASECAPARHARWCIRGASHSQGGVARSLARTWLAQWVADEANKICDAPGSWYCTGQYPPALGAFPVHTGDQ